MTLHTVRAARALLVLVLVGGWLAGCSESPQDQIVGRWQDAENANGSILEFFKGGTVSFQESITGIAINGDYEFLDDETMKIELGGILAIAGASLYKVSFDNGRLLLTAQNSDGVLAYNRID